MMKKLYIFTHFEKIYLIQNIQSIMQKERDRAIEKIIEVFCSLNIKLSKN